MQAARHGTHVRALLHTKCRQKMTYTIVTSLRFFFRAFCQRNICHAACGRAGHRMTTPQWMMEVFLCPTPTLVPRTLVPAFFYPVAVPLYFWVLLCMMYYDVVGYVWALC